MGWSLSTRCSELYPSLLRSALWTERRCLAWEWLLWKLYHAYRFKGLGVDPVLIESLRPCPPSSVYIDGCLSLWIFIFLKNVFFSPLSSSHSVIFSMSCLLVFSFVFLIPERKKLRKIWKFWKHWSQTYCWCKMLFNNESCFQFHPICRDIWKKREKKKSALLSVCRLYIVLMFFHWLVWYLLWLALGTVVRLQWLHQQPPALNKHYIQTLL